MTRRGSSRRSARRSAPSQSATRSTTRATSRARAQTPSCDNIDAYAEIIRPFGEIGAIDEPEGLDLLALKSKSVSWHWELMFTRSMFETPDMIEQKHLLSRVAELVDEQRVRTTMTESIADFSAAGLRLAHEMVESGRMTGKVVVHR
jgi:NADPH:quinone reductase-like Zn-dependent oxidoreductase